MNWVTIIWLMMAGASLTLALVHLSIWLAQKDQRANLAFSCIAIGVAAFGAMELAAMSAQTIPQYALRLRLLHIPAWIIIVSMVWFTRAYLRAGRMWLGWTVVAMRTFYLAAALLPSVNVNYRHIDALIHRPLLGQQLVIGVGVPNPWMVFGQSCVVLLTIFLIDASIQVWRRGDHRRAILVGASMSFFSAQMVTIWVLVFWQILQTPSASSWGYLLMLIAMGYELSRDVLSAAQLAGKLKESEMRFRTVADAAPVLIWMSGTDKRCTFLNKTWTDFTGRRFEEELGDGWSAGVHPEDLARCLRTYEDAFDARRPFNMEYRLRRHDAEFRWIMDEGVPLYGGNGQFAGYIGSCIDVTERRNAEAKFRIAIEGSPNAIVMADPEGNIALLNSRSERLFGYFSRELIGQPIEMLLPERLRASHCEHRLKFMAAPAAREIGTAREFLAQRKDGTEFPVEIGLNPIFTDEGIFVLGAIVDLSARRYSEAEISELREHLSHLARVSTMGQLASALAHEINQPLGAILRNAEAADLLLQKESPDIDELRAIVDDIQQDDHRAGEVIDRLRRLLKHRQIDLRSLFIDTVVDESIGLVRAYADAREVKIDVKLHPRLPKVRGDRVHLQQVLINLLLNAMDAVDGQAEDGRRIVTVGVDRNGGNTVEVAVSDQGHGISSDRLAHIFEPFFSTKSDGMGMGLPISRTIIEAHGGRIWAENNPQGQGGATVRFTLKADEEGPVCNES